MKNDAKVLNDIANQEIKKTLDLSKEATFLEKVCTIIVDDYCTSWAKLGFKSCSIDLNDVLKSLNVNYSNFIAAAYDDNYTFYKDVCSLLNKQGFQIEKTSHDFKIKW